jgi:ankyrin repeat protein
MSSSWSSAVIKLATLASKGDRDGCLLIIPTLEPHEINTILDSTTKITFLHRACQFQELPIISSLLEHGADITLLNSDGQSCWSLAILQNSLPILTTLAPYVHPNLSSALVSLIYSKLSESDILSLLKILFSNHHQHHHQSEWVDSHSDVVHHTVFLNQFEILKYLLQNGFEQTLYQYDSYGLSPLQIIERTLIWSCLTEEKRNMIR